MVLINYAGREINAKIVYYGPGLSGKTTNLECIYASVPAPSRGKMVSMKTRQDRTLFFDFLPLELGEVHGFRTRFLLYTVPGQVFYNATRKLVLKGADAVVFVADSDLGKMEGNLESLRNLDENLREQGLVLENMPFVLQYNKRDLPEVYSVEEMDKALNPRGVQRFEAAAATGHGVYETLHAVSRLLFQRLLTDLRPSGRPGVAPGGPAPQAAPSAPRQAPALAAQGVGQAGGGRAAAPQRSAPGGAAHGRGGAGGPGGSGTGPHRPGLEPSPADFDPVVGAAPSGSFQRSGLGLEPSPQLFGKPGRGHVPQPPTSERILDSVRATAQGLEITEPELAPEAGSEGYADYGHVVDLAEEAAVPAPAPTAAPRGPAPQRGDADAEGFDGLIQDPLRRRERAASGRAGSPGGTVVTKHVSVLVSRDELKGGSVRILVHLRVEP